MTTNGILNVNKPSGITSFGVVSIVKRLSGERRVGHAGTLDPLAVGVLPVCLGYATRVIEYLVEATKTYRAEIELGVATDTYDAAGQVTQQGDVSLIDRDCVETALGAFRGNIQQTPPMYSAVKYRGQPLYELARAGIAVERGSREARVHHLELIDWQPCLPSALDSGRRAPVITIEVVCGKGTYIRSLAHDLGQMLGCGAYLRSLIRLSYGPFDIKDAIALPQLEESIKSGGWSDILYPPDYVLRQWPAVVLNGKELDDLKMGRFLTPGEGWETAAGASLPPDSAIQKLCRAYALDGRFVGVLRFNLVSQKWQPEKVFLRDNRPEER